MKKLETIVNDEPVNKTADLVEERISIGNTTIH